MVNVLAVIPARGGSKRLPRKNIMPLNGKPLIGYTIEAAKKSKSITHSIFSTDDKDIKKIAEECGAYAPFLRPKNISGDDVRNSATMRHALEFMEKENSITYDCVLLLQPTSPLRNFKHIDEAISIYIESGATSLAAVKGPYKKRDINLKRIESGRLVNLQNKNEEYYVYNASIYIVSREWLLKENRFTSEDEIGYIMDEASSVDVDTELDIWLAEAALKYKESKNG